MRLAPRRVSESRFHRVLVGRCPNCLLYQLEREEAVRASNGLSTLSARPQLRQQRPSHLPIKPETLPPAPTSNSHYSITLRPRRRSSNPPSLAILSLFLQRKPEQDASPAEHAQPANSSRSLQQQPLLWRYRLASLTSRGSTVLVLRHHPAATTSRVQQPRCPQCAQRLIA